MYKITVMVIFVQNVEIYLTSPLRVTDNETDNQWFYLIKGVAACITCSAEAVDCAGEVVTVTATVAFIACLILRSTAAANDVH